MNRPVRKMVLERIVPGGTGFGLNRPVTEKVWGRGGCVQRMEVIVKGKKSQWGGGGGGGQGICERRSEAFVKIQFFFGGGGVRVGGGGVRVDVN